MQLNLDKSGAFDSKENKEMIPGLPQKEMVPGNCEDFSCAPTVQ